MIKDDYGNPKFYGLYRGVVVDNKDPLNKGRLRLQIPQVMGNSTSGWAWGVFPSGTTTSLPEVGSGVFVMFEGGDLVFPIWTGVFRQTDTTPIPFVSTWAGTGLVASGNPAIGTYTKLGKLVFFNIKVSFTTVTNFGTGQYSLTLPFQPDADYVFRDGGLHQGSVHYDVAMDIEEGSKTGLLYHTQATNGANSYAYDDPFTSSNPHALTTSGYFYISGTYTTSET